MSVTVMKKLTALASLRDADRLVRRLMRLRCVEIVSIPLEEMADGGALLRYDSDSARAEAERRVADVTAALALLDEYAIHEKPRSSPIAVTAEEFRESGRLDAARAAVAEALQARDDRTAAQTERNRMEALGRSLAPWREYSASPEGEETALCEVWLGTLPPETPISAADDALAGLHAGVEEVSRDEDALYAAVLTLKEDGDATARALAALGFVKTSRQGVLKDLPVEGAAAENIAFCQKRISELDERLSALKDTVTLYQPCTHRPR